MSSPPDVGSFAAAHDKAHILAWECGRTRRALLEYGPAPTIPEAASATAAVGSIAP